MDDVFVVLQIFCLDQFWWHRLAHGRTSWLPLATEPFTTSRWTPIQVSMTIFPCHSSLKHDCTCHSSLKHDCTCMCTYAASLKLYTLVCSVTTQCNKPVLAVYFIPRISTDCTSSSLLSISPLSLSLSLPPSPLSLFLSLPPSPSLQAP